MKKNHNFHLIMHKKLIMKILHYNMHQVLISAVHYRDKFYAQLRDSCGNFVM